VQTYFVESGRLSKWPQRTAFKASNAQSDLLSLPDLTLGDIFSLLPARQR